MASHESSRRSACQPAWNISISAASTASRRGASSGPAGQASDSPASRSRARQPLREGGLVGEQAVGDGLQVQRARRAQRQRHLRRHRQCRVAGGEEQRQLVVVQLAGEAALGRRHRERGVVVALGQRVQPRMAAQLVHRPAPGHAVEPAAGVGRHAFGGPVLQRAQARGLHRVFGQRQVRQAERARQVGDEAAALRGFDHGMASTRRISIQLLPTRCGQPAAMRSASASVSALIVK
jgi:hypothetical protein